MAEGFPSRASFLTDMTLDPPQATSDLAGAPLQDEDYLTLSIIHSAKGQEWRSVFVLNCVDGCIPSDRATGTPAEIEEERRLFYVAMTRAKDALHLMTPLRFYIHGQTARGDKHIYAARTRFVPAHILDRFEQRAVGSRRQRGRLGGAADAHTRSEGSDAKHVVVDGLDRSPGASVETCRRRLRRRSRKTSGSGWVGPNRHQPWPRGPFRGGLEATSGCTVHSSRRASPVRCPRHDPAIRSARRQSLEARYRGV